MFGQSSKKHRKNLVSAATVLTLAGIVIAPLAYARITVNTIDPGAIVSDNGHHIIATGPVTCTEGERAYLRVTVTQRSTGAVAEGQTRINCTGDLQQWEVQASAHGNEAFREGPATAVAVARTTSQGETTDAHQWLVDITLAGE